jgi:hypothetical protein
LPRAKEREVPAFDRTGGHRLQSLAADLQQAKLFGIALANVLHDIEPKFGLWQPSATWRGFEPQILAPGEAANMP